MHHALAIQEILENILSFTDKQSDARMAVVCRIWHDPSLDALWYHIEDLACFYGMMDTYNASDSEISVKPHWQRKIKPESVTPEFWTRFKLYASRVKSLDLSHYETRATLAHLHEAAEKSPLFCNTVGLAILGSAHGRISPDIDEVHTGLKFLTLECHWPDAIVVRRAPHLTHLRLTVPTKRERDNVWAGILAHLPQLQVYQGGIPGSLTWNVASRLPSLRSISLFRASFQQQLHWLGTGPKINNGEWQELRSFAANCVTANALINALHSSLTFSPLQSIIITRGRINHDERENVSDTLLEQLFRALKPYWSLMEHLRLEFGNRWSQDPFLNAINPFFSDVIRDLSNAKNLTHLFLSFKRPLPISDRQFTDIISEMPFLQTCIFNPSPVLFCEGDRLSFDALNSLAKYCSSIKYVALSIGCTRTSTTGEAPAHFRQLSNLHICFVDHIADLAQEAPSLVRLVGACNHTLRLQRASFIALADGHGHNVAHGVMFRCRRQIKLLAQQLLELYPYSREKMNDGVILSISV